MGAVYGILSHSGESGEETFLKLGAALAHRGGAHGSVFRDHGVALGAASNSPAAGSGTRTASRRDDLFVAADARLDNLEELASKLELNEPVGHCGIAEVLAEAYRKWGTACVGHLLGDFAVVIWDSRRRTLFAARDHFGVKPLYYCSTADFFALASEPQALLAGEILEAQPNEEMIADFLIGVPDESSATFYRKLSRLCPGESLVVREGRIQTQRYYQLDPDRCVRFKTDREYAEAFREVFFRAVRRRLPGAGRIGCLVSGGLDSSSIACTAARVLGQQQVGRLELFSRVFPEQPQCDESEYIGAVTEATGARSHLLPGSTNRTLADLRDLIATTSEPSTAPGAFGFGNIYGEVQRAGVHVLLDGHGGDETVSTGADWLRELAQQNRWLAFARAYLPLARRSGETAPIRSLVRVLAQFGMLERVRSRVSRWRRLASRKAATDVPRPGAWSWGLSDRLIHSERTQQRKNWWLRQQPAAAPTEHLCHFRVLAGTGQSRALELLDRRAAAAGVEGRYPFWDKDVVEFCLALPPEQKLSRGFPRAILRRGLHDVLPPAVRDRVDKMDFTPQLAGCIRSIQRTDWHAFIAENAGPARDWTSAEWLRAQVDRVFDDTNSTKIPAGALWRSLSLATWLKSFPQMAGTA